jgi:hypothetical protein
MSHEHTQSVVRLMNEVSDTSPSRNLAMLLLTSCEKVARKLEHFDREVVAFAMRSAAQDLVGAQAAESTKWQQ